MKRKVVKQGPSTYMVSLPSKWVKANGVNKGDELEVLEDGRNLIFSQGAVKQKEKKEKVVDISNYELFLKRHLFIPYWKGYDIIKVYYQGADQLKKIIETANYMLGFEVVDQNENYCILKNIAKGIDEELETMINRLFMIIISTNKEMVEYSNQDKKELVKIAIQKSFLVARLDIFCKRVLNKKGYKGYNIGPVYRVVALLEAIGDEQEEILKLLSIGLKVDKKLSDLFMKLNKLTQFLYNLFKKPNWDNLVLFKKRNLELKNLCKKNLESSSGKKSLLLSHILSILEKSHHMTEEFNFA